MPISLTEMPAPAAPPDPVPAGADAGSHTGKKGT